MFISILAVLADRDEGVLIVVLGNIISILAVLADRDKRPDGGKGAL